MASGNIGLPFATAVRQSNELDVMVLEASSFQLENHRAFRPHVSVWVEPQPQPSGPLSRYGGIPHGPSSGFSRIRHRRTTRWSTPGSILPPIAANQITFSAYVPDVDFSLRDGVIHYRNGPVLDQGKTRLAGVHNAENLMAALGAGLALGLDFERMAGAVR